MPAAGRAHVPGDALQDAAASVLDCRVTAGAARFMAMLNTLQCRNQAVKTFPPRSIKVL